MDGGIPDSVGPLLVVDDSGTQRHALADALADAGYVVRVAASGEEALRLMAREVPACILLDMTMPGLSGEETCRRIKHDPRLRDTPVMLLTAREDPEATLEALNAGADDFVAKSTDVAVLLARVRAQLRRKRIEDEGRALLLRGQAQLAEAEAARQLAATRAQLLEDLRREHDALVRSQAEREALLAELREAVHARDEFMGIASHELRTPLTSLRLNLHALQEATAAQEPGALAPRLAKMDRQVRRLTKLVCDLLDVARINGDALPLELEEVDLGELAAQMPSRFADDLARTGCALHVHAAPGLVGRWDRVRLEQVLTNLVSNALKYGAGCPVELRAWREGSRAFVSVRDQGIGIAPADHARVFERFARAVSSRHYGGFGLGLWISRMIVEGMGGAIRVESASGKGATFTVALPLAGGPPA